jgi:PKD repeat protein
MPPGLPVDFGDGGVGGDQKIVTHTYNQPGIYSVMLYSYDEFNNVDSSLDLIEIKGPYALLKADTLYACNSLQVKLNADVRNAKDFTWDFGDGNTYSRYRQFCHAPLC